MSNQNVFVLPKNQYKRNLDLLKYYVSDAALYLSLMTDKPLKECRSFVSKSLSKGGKFEFKDPKIDYLERDNQGDRVRKEGTLSQFFSESIKEEHLIAPNLTTYLPASQEKSYLAAFIDSNVAARSKAKKEKFAAEMAGDHIQMEFKENEQRSRKTRNNSISGGHVTSSTPLYNKTSHSTLTSNCRTTSGFGNANNEKLLCGNRHYWNPKITLNNVISIVNHSDLEKIQSAMDAFNLKAPTVEEMMECITYSSNQYWRSDYVIKTLTDLTSKLSPVQRAAFVYTGDLYHVMKLNDFMMKTFISKLSLKVMEDCEDPSSVFKSHREEYQILATMYFPNEIAKAADDLFPDNPKKNVTLKDLKGSQLEQWIASTVKHIEATVQEYRLFIEAFLVTTNVPASLAFFPDSIRRAALTSDTDSTIFTVQDWVFWMHGNDPGFNENTEATAAAMIFLAAETITHILARMSANFGIETNRIHQIAMKNEFKFGVFIPTNVGKHYFAAITAQEGNIYRRWKLEKKGVHLKSSNAPPRITQQAEDMMKDILQTVMAGKKLSLRKYLIQVADTEREIRRSILAGESTYLRTAQIKTPDSYTKDKMGSPWQHYDLWQSVFSQKYGDAPPPPYAALKVSIQLDSTTELKAWIEGIEDRALAQRLQDWFTRNNKGLMSQLLLPIQTMQISGMPVEVAMIANIRRSIFDISNVFYLILEVLNYHARNEDLSHLLLDYY